LELTLGKDPPIREYRERTLYYASVTIHPYDAGISNGRLAYAGVIK